MDGADDHWRTETGGLLFLLNALQHTPLRRRVAESLHSPWLWFLRLVEALGWQPDTGMLALIANRLGEEDVTVLADWPAIANLEAEGELLADRYGRHVFWQEPDWWRLPARIAADETHLDVYVHLNSARADIRLAGLDLSPGWLPWLAMVVDFHYVSDPGLLPGSATKEGP